MGISMGEDCTVIAATEKAVLVATPDEGEVWVPRSVLAPHDDDCFDEDSEQHDMGELVVRTWWAEGEGYA